MMGQEMMGQEVPQSVSRWRRALKAGCAAGLAAWRGAAAAQEPVMAEQPVPWPNYIAQGTGQGTAQVTGQDIGADTALAHVIAVLDVPLVLLDDEARVMALSQGAKLLMPALSQAKPISLAMRDPDALAAIARVRQTGVAEQIELVEHSQLGRSIRISMALLANDALANDALASPTSGSGPEGRVLLNLQDLSEAKTIERMRADFVANASHELRTPLATLLGFIETLQGPAKADEAARMRFLGIMNDQARRMSRLIDDLLSLSRIEQYVHQAPRLPVDLVAIIREIIDSLSVMASDRGVVVAGPAAGAAAIVAGDRDDLLRLVENLVENAIKYGQDGKKVDVTIGTEAEQVVLGVRDYGPGISQEHLPRLTERFYRVDAGASREAGGTGLGLAIVKHIVLRHRGRLVIESELGHGACFKVLLPLQKA